MYKICFITGLIAFVSLTGQISAKSFSDNNSVTDSNNQRFVTVPNDLADGDLLTKPKVVKQTITVGGAGSDISGFTSTAVQIAVDALKQRGGTVQLKAGTYKISAPIRLASNISLVGAGDSTILKKVDGYRSPLVVDGDYGMFKVTVQDARGFSPGMGVQLSDSQYPSDYDVTIATIVAIDGNTIFIDQPTLRDYGCANKAVLSNTCSVVDGTGVENVHIANFSVDGNKKTNDVLGGCRGEAIYLSSAVGCLIENVKVKDFNGDVFGWQISKDITVRNCEASYCNGFGFHPGTGSENTLIEGCSSHHNVDGIFLCWRVKRGTFRNNTVYGNDRDGISINKKDTDNIFLNNHIYQNGRNGVWFNDYGESDNSHRNSFVENVIEDNGTKERGCGFCIDSNIRDIFIRKNTIRDNGKGLQKCGVLIGKRALNIQVLDNAMTGHSDGDIVHK
jgi:parallel beta-helix repeat protein